MAHGDASYARGNVDWIDDPRCLALADNDSRWVHEALWRIAVKHRSEVIPAEYTPASLAAKCRVSEEKLRDCIKDIARQNLIRFTQDGKIVVRGVVKNHPKMQIACAPRDTVNPYYVKGYTGWLDGPNDTGMETDPYPPDTGPVWDPSREEKSREEKIDTDCPEAQEAAPSEPPSDPVYLTFPTVGKVKEWHLRKSLLDDFYHTYSKHLDVLGECKKARLYVLANDGHRKTPGGMRKFLTNWLARAIDNGRGLKPLSKDQARAEAEQARRAAEASRRQPGTPTAAADVLAGVLANTGG